MHSQIKPFLELSTDALLLRSQAARSKRTAHLSLDNGKQLHLYHAAAIRLQCTAEARPLPFRYDLQEAVEDM